MSSADQSSLPGTPLPTQSKICFIVCDPTRAEFINVYGDFTRLLTSMFTSLTRRFSRLSQKGILPEVIKPFHIVPFEAFENHFPDLATIDQYDSIIVSGSSHSVNDADGAKNHWIEVLGSLLNTVATKFPNIKIIGMCFDHHLISQSVFRDRVEPNSHWEIGPYRVDLNSIGKRLFPGRDHLNLAMFHQDAVRPGRSGGIPAHMPDTIQSDSMGWNLFSGVVSPRESTTPSTSTDPSPDNSDAVPLSKRFIWGSTPETPNQGIIALRDGVSPDDFGIDDIHIFTIQGHPEMSSGMISLLVEIFETDLGPEACKAGREKIANFKGSLDWLPVGLLMWAISTRHTISLSAFSKALEELSNMADAAGV